MGVVNAGECVWYKASKSVATLVTGWIRTFPEFLCSHVVMAGFVEAVGTQASEDIIVNWLLVR